jgi:uncharacterized protein (DUF433 family)
MSSLETVSLKEAQFILGRPEADINRAIDRGYIDKLTDEVVEPAEPVKKRKRAVRRGRGRKGSGTMYYRASPTVKRKVRKLGQAELVFLAIEQQFHADLTPAGRRKLYDAIKAGPSRAGKVTVGPFEVETKSAVQRIRDRLRELRNLRGGIVQRSVGDPLIKGTDLSVYVIASLAEGQTLEEVVEDYPGLTLEQVSRAVAYAQAYPKKGRPYPTRSFKRMLGDLAASGALDDGSEADDPLTIDMLR